MFKTALRLVAFLLIAGSIPIVCYPKANASPLQAKLVSASPVPSPPLKEETPVEDFLSGQVVKVTPGHILLKQQAGSIIVLHLLPTTNVWGGLWVKSIPIAVGDRIDARVKRRNNGVFDVQKMWVNIVSLEGDILSVQKKADGFQLSLLNRFVGTVIVKIEPRTEVTRQGKEVTFSNSLIELRTGKLVRIVGRRLRNGSVIATELLVE